MDSLMLKILSSCSFIPQRSFDMSTFFSIHILILHTNTTLIAFNILWQDVPSPKGWGGGGGFLQIYLSGLKSEKVHSGSFRSTF